jgi:hypothetical protein
MLSHTGGIAPTDAAMNVHPISATIGTQQEEPDLPITTSSATIFEPTGSNTLPVVFLAAYLSPSVFKVNEVS